jgi:hypothetical protein
MNTLDNNILSQWLKKPTNTAINYPNTAQHLAQWLAKGNWKITSDLSEGLWQSIEQKIQL